ncbi:LacI family transcriptional regulator [Brachybacterium halotolerans subsp. kimchii]|uniref:LacI family DNA-binding transcriptional regulator n=1 Tax=Brachybacterium halotolerans TaxID=2795215 RepID=UPI001E5F3C5B|nr:LacI family DNA-binding transcriptional regulator [Brachybacterium halotolerans]UEJ81487.1 LacI family transcriptional regulator [Brachybacterium halotolerans subsp. kimchii]
MRRSAPTSQDVARLAGVSQSTVSYVLTGSRPISAATRRRVEEAIEKLGYHPNSGARALRSRRSGVLGLMVPEAYGNDAVLMRFVGAIAREAQRFGYDILLVTAQEGARGIHRVVRTGVCEALILMELGRHDERVAAVIEAGLPFVLIGKPVGFPNGSVVDLDFERLGRMVVDRAADEGCERLLLFGEPGHRRHRNDVSRFLLGIEEQAQTKARADGAGLEVVLDAGELPDVPARARELARGGRRTAVFGLNGVTEVLFATAASGALDDPHLLLLALTDEDLAQISPLLAQIPRIDPRRVEISELAVRELVRLLREEGASPRVTLVEPEWVEQDVSDPG